MEETNALENRIGVLTKVSSDIVEVTYKGNNDATLKEIQDLASKAYALMNDKPFYLINTIVHDVGSFPDDVWEFIGTSVKHSSMVLGCAVVSKNMGYIMQINFFVKKYTPKFPFKIMDTQAEALKWIEEQR
jgi:hypothetical protein